MEIVIGKTAGFCYGVKRAVHGAKKELEKDEKVMCLGEIVHNKKVIEELENRGMKFMDDIEKSSKNVIIRAHGVPKEIYEQAKKEEINLIDYTCPNVLKIHEIVEKYSNKGFAIFLCGSKAHPENIGTISYARGNGYVIEKIEDIYEAIEILENKEIDKILLISQTTFSLSEFEEIEKKMKEIIEKDKQLVIKNTICSATELRQKETKKIANDVDFMIIIGGKNSSNTKKLYEIAKKECQNAIVIESAEELSKGILDKIKKSAKIGIMAGASTPDISIIEVKQVIEKI